MTRSSKLIFVQFSFLLGCLVASRASFAADGAFCSSLADPNSQPLTNVRAEDVGKDQAGKGLEADCSQIRTAIEQQIGQQIVTWQATGLKTPQIKMINDGYTKYKNSRNGCLNGQMRAATMCLEGWSPNMAETAAQVNMVLTGLGSQSTNESCGKFADAMKLAQAGITAYSGACGVAKAGCGVACMRARGGLESMKKAIQGEMSGANCAGSTDPSCAHSLSAYQSLLQSASAAVDNELAEAEKRSIAGKASACNSKYAALAASGLAGIAGIMQSLKQGKECDKQTEADPIADITAKCALSENAGLPECICLSDPRTPGCSNSLEKIGSSPNGGSPLAAGATDKTNSIGKQNTDIGGVTDTGIEQAARSTASAGGMAGAPQGGGAGLSGSSGVGGGKGNGAGGGAAGSGLNTDILSGTSGGGSGGGGFGRAGGGSSNSGYRDFLPGGKQDPSKGLAGQQGWTKEVTGHGGKSNFDKVKERYQDNKNTLLGN